MYNIDPESENYMNEKNMQDAIVYIVSKVAHAMTPDLRNILSISYPMATDDQMIESIKNKAKLVVLNYSIKQNNDNSITMPNITALT